MKQLFIILLFIFSWKNTFAQKEDKFRVYTGVSSGLVVMRLSGTMDKGNGGMSFTTNSVLVARPQYRHVDTTALALNVFVPIGFNIPVYRSKKWSAGFKLSAGVGYQAGVKAADGLSSMGFDFPQFVYYRRYSGKIDYSVLAGWKYSYVPLPYQLCLLGFDMNFEDTQLRFYFSPFPYKYYRELTNGTIEPAAKIYEIGLGYFYNFGR
jgi:hypothetical protein